MSLQWGAGIRAIAWPVIKHWIRVQFPAVRSLSTAELAAWLQRTEQEQPLLLDVRTQAEYEVSHLPGASLAPAPEELDQWQEMDCSTPIVTYCSVGYRSARLAQQLQERGYERVLNLEGSLFQWANEGRPVYQNGRVVRQVHPYSPFWEMLLNRHIKSG